MRGRAKGAVGNESEGQRYRLLSSHDWRTIVSRLQRGWCTLHTLARLLAPMSVIDAVLLMVLFANSVHSCIAIAVRCGDALAVE